MKHTILFIQGVLTIMILLGSQARADFLGLAPGDYTVTLQDVNFGNGDGLLNNMTGRVHIPSGPVTVSNFSWHFAIVDCCGPVLFDWTGKLFIQQNSDGSSSALEEATGPARLCDVNTFCFPIFELLYNPARNFGFCAEGFCPQYWEDPYNYLTNHFGGWSAQAIPEPSALLLLGFGLIVSAVWERRKLMSRRSTIWDKVTLKQ